MVQAGQSPCSQGGSWATALGVFPLLQCFSMAASDYFHAQTMFAAKQVPNSMS